MPQRALASVFLSSGSDDFKSLFIAPKPCLVLSELVKKGYILSANLSPSSIHSSLTSALLCIFYTGPGVLPVYFYTNEEICFDHLEHFALMIISFTSLLRCSLSC